MTQLTADGVFTASELIDMLTHPERREDYLRVGLKRAGKSLGGAAQPVKKDAPTPQSSGGGFAVSREGDYFIFSGRGWGHGVGLSQWGCQTLAKNGWTAERILAHYYPGTEVKRYR